MNDIIINVIIGLITGGVSGWVVSIYFRNRDKREERRRKFESEKSNKLEFSRLLLLELEFLINDPSKNKENILRMMASIPNFTVIAGSPGKENVINRVMEHNRMIREIELYLRNNDVIDAMKLRSLRSEFLMTYVDFTGIKYEELQRKPNSD